jgi:hypothetical protein
VENITEIELLRIKTEELIEVVRDGMSRLALGDFGLGGFFAHGAEGGGSDFDLFAGAVFQSDAYGAQVGQLTLLGFVVGVGYVVSDQGAFTGYLTSSCHDRAF